MKTKFFFFSIFEELRDNTIRYLLICEGYVSIVNIGWISVK